MGQYFKPVNFDKMEALLPREIKQGTKLMEHSYVGNNLLNVVESLLLSKWKGDRIVWAGDYASREEEPPHDKDREVNLYSSGLEVPYPFDTSNWGYEDQVPKTKARYFVNLDKEQFVDQLASPVMQGDYQIHPLPLLTASSNGQGGGDYFSPAGASYLGTWSGDRIEAVEDSEQAFDQLINNGFKQIRPYFTEEVAK